MRSKYYDSKFGPEWHQPRRGRALVFTEQERIVRARVSCKRRRALNRKADNARINRWRSENRERINAQARARASAKREAGQIYLPLAPALQDQSP